MAYDIGARVGIDGEKEFRDSIRAIDGQLKTFAAQMQAVTAEFEDNAQSEDALTQKNKVLRESISTVEKQLDVLSKQTARQKQRALELADALERAKKEFGENSEQAGKAQNAYNKQVVEVNKLETQIAKATANLNKMNNQLRKNTDSLDGLGNELTDTSQDFSVFGDVLSANLVSSAITSTISGIANGLKEITTESREFRKIMGSLEISSEKAGYSAEQTTAAYNQLYGVLADNQTAATTTANLQALGLEQDQLNQLINGTIGAWATYGDSIPIDGLAEAINETAKVGEVTGTFADVLNWAGTSEDEFNERLAECSDQSERANLILQEMSRQGLMAAGEGWQKNNKSLVEANQAAADYEATMAEMGETVEPVITAVQQGFNEFLGMLVMLMQMVDFAAIAGGITTIMQAAAGLINGVQSGSLTAQDAFAVIFSGLQQLLSNIYAYLTANLPQIIQSGMEMIVSFSAGIVQAIPDALTALGQLITRLVGDIMGYLPQFIQSGAEMIVSMGQGILQALPEIIAQAVSVVAQFAATILANLPEIVQSGVSLIGQLIAGIISALPDLIASIPQLIAGISDTIHEYDWLGLGGDILRGLVAGIADGIGAVIEAAKDAAGKIKNAFTEFFDIHSPSRVMKDEVGRQITAGIAEGILANEDYAEKSAEEVASAIVSAAEKQLSNYQVYHDMTLAEEAAFWDEMRQKVAEGTQARIDADKKYFDAKKKLDSQILNVEKKYSDSVSQVYQDLSKNISDAWDNYHDQVDSLADSIRSQLNLFEEFDFTTEQTTDSLLKNLESQVEGMTVWRNSLKKLASRGLPQELLEELEGMGVSAAGELQVLSEMTDDELDKYISLWSQKNSLANQAAREQSEPLFEETQEQIREMRREAKAELQAYQEEFVASMESIGVALIGPLEQIKNALVQNYVDTIGTAANAVSQQANDEANKEKYAQVAQNIIAASDGLPESFYSIGVDTVNGIINGLNSQSSALYQTMEQIINGVVLAAQQTMQIHSPSRVMENFIGKNIIAGLAEGLTKYQGMAIKAAQGVYAGVSGAMDVPRTANGTAAAYNRLADSLGNMQIVLNDGTLVGKLTPRIDAALGGYTKLKGRYYT